MKLIKQIDEALLTVPGMAVDDVTTRDPDSALMV